MRNNISYIIICRSYLVSRSLSEIIVDEYGKVEVIDKIDNIDSLLSLIERTNAACIFADSDVVEICNLYMNKIPKRAVIIPLLDTEEIRSNNGNYDHMIDINEQKSRILQIIHKASESAESAIGKDEKSKPLTSRERIILQYVARGLTTKKIADKLNISVQTVSSHRKNICNKLEIKSASGLTAYAIINGLIDLNETNLR
mgnify:CR=1 FL=1